MTPTNTFFLPHLDDLLDTSEECLLSPPDTNRPINHITAQTKVRFLLSYNTDSGLRTHPVFLKARFPPVADKRAVLMCVSR